MVWVEPRETAEATREAIAAAFEGRAPRFVVLVGDVPQSSGGATPVEARGAPTFYVPARVNVLFGSEDQIAGDHGYADFDGDGLPDAAVGRLSAATPEQLAMVVEKILSYEQPAERGAWRRRVSFVAGVGGFGPLTDWAVEAFTRSALARHIPPAYVTTMTHASWQSPYCPDPRLFQTTAIERHNEGCLFWVYLGHGHRRTLDRLQTPAGSHTILEAEDVERLRAAGRPPIAVLLACYSGAFDGAEDCLAEAMLRSAGGPVAVVCGSRVTMPYGMAVLGVEMAREAFAARRQTVGEVLLHAKRSVAGGSRDDWAARQLDAMARLLNPLGSELGDERWEHLWLFNLLGDPLLRLPHPEPAAIDAPREATAGTAVEISGTCPCDGEAEVELVLRRDRLPIKPPQRSVYDDSPAARAEQQAVYHRANDARLASGRVRVEGGVFRLPLLIPAEAWGQCHLRVFVDGPGGWAAGAADILVRRAETPLSAQRPSQVK